MLSLKIMPDHDPEDPRDWDNLGKMVCFHRRYNLGDKHDFDTPGAFLRWAKYVGIIKIPLYLYDHSGITMSYKPFHDEWDSGQVGWIYVTKESVRKDFSVNKITKKIKERVLKVLKGEVETYDKFLTGDIYGFELYDDDEFVDSCWGFYGTDWKENGMIAHIGKEHEDLVKNTKITYKGE